MASKKARNKAKPKQAKGYKKAKPQQVVANQKANQQQAASNNKAKQQAGSSKAKVQHDTAQQKVQAQYEAAKAKVVKANEGINFFLFKVQNLSAFPPQWHRMVLRADAKLSDLSRQIEENFGHAPGKASFYRDSGCDDKISSRAAHSNKFNPDLTLREVFIKGHCYGYLCGAHNELRHTVMVEHAEAQERDLPNALQMHEFGYVTQDAYDQDLDDFDEEYLFADDEYDDEDEYEDDYDEDDEYEYDDEADDEDAPVGCFALKVELVGAQPPVRRVIDVNANDQFSDLVEQMLEAFDIEQELLGTFYRDLKCTKPLCSSLNGDYEQHPNHYLGSELKKGQRLCFAFGLMQSKKLAITVEDYALERKDLEYDSWGNEGDFEDIKVPERYYLIKVTLSVMKKQVWRRILISNHDHFSDLQDEVISAFSWEDSYSYESAFYCDPKCRYTFCQTDEDEWTFDFDPPLFQFLEPGIKFGLSIDLAEHVLEVEREVKSKSELPQNLVWRRYDFNPGDFFLSNIFDDVADEDDEFADEDYEFDEEDDAEDDDELEGVNDAEDDESDESDEDELEDEDDEPDEDELEGENDESDEDELEGENDESDEDEHEGEDDESDEDELEDENDEPEDEDDEADEDKPSAYQSDAIFALAGYFALQIEQVGTKPPLRRYLVISADVQFSDFVIEMLDLLGYYGQEFLGTFYRDVQGTELLCSSLNDDEMMLPDPYLGHELKKGLHLCYTFGLMQRQKLAIKVVDRALKQQDLVFDADYSTGKIDLLEARARTYLLKVTVQDINKQVWRRIAISNKDHFSDLQAAVISALGWGKIYKWESVFYCDPECNYLFCETNFDKWSFDFDPPLFQFLEPGIKFGLEIDSNELVIEVEREVKTKSELPANLVWRQGNYIPRALDDDDDADDDDEFDDLLDDDLDDDEEEVPVGCYALKVEQVGAQPPLRRTLVVSANQRFSDLSVALLRALGFEQNCLGSFYRDAKCRKMLCSSFTNIREMLPNPYVGSELKKGLSLYFAYGLMQSKKLKITVSDYGWGPSDLACDPGFAVGSLEDDSQIPECSYLLKVTLKASKQQVERRIVLGNKQRFSDLQQAVGKSLGWDDSGSSAYFYIDPECNFVFCQTDLERKVLDADPQLCYFLEPGIKFGLKLDRLLCVLEVEREVKSKDELPQDLVWSKGELNLRDFRKKI